MHGSETVQFVVQAQLGVEMILILVVQLLLPIAASSGKL